MNIGLHGGIVEEKHRQAMGQAIWLYMWLVKRQTRRNGLVLGGSPLTFARISEETHYPERSMQRWLRDLQIAGYIEVTYLNFKMLRIRILKAKKFGVTQSDLPFTHPPKVAEGTVQPSAKSGGRVPPKVADSGAKSGGSKQSLTMSSNETPETPRAMPDGIAGIVPIPVWLSFVKMRRAIGKPLSEGDADLFVRRLVEFQSEGQDPIAILEQSIMSRWAGIFPLKGNRNGEPESFEERRQRKSSEALSEVRRRADEILREVETTPRLKSGEQSTNRGVLGGPVRPKP